MSFNRFIISLLKNASVLEKKCHIAHRHVQVTKWREHITLKYFIILQVLLYCLQCFDAVGWAAGRASGL